MDVSRMKVWSLAYAGGAVASPVLGTTVSWQAGLLALGVLLIIFGCGLLSQREQRKTLIALIREAPEGTLVVHSEGSGGPFTRIRVGRTSRKGTQ
jgi:hypothetical protein